MLRRFLTFAVLAGIIWHCDKARAQTSWYMELGAGLGVKTDFAHEGYNLDTLCYPTNPECPQHKGFTWQYDISADHGSALFLTLGRRMDQWRVELSGARDVRSLEHSFSSITYLDGRAIPPPLDHGVIEQTESGLGSLIRNAARLNAFIDLVDSDPRIQPYVGAGIGLSHLTATDVYFSSHFLCAADAICPPNLDAYMALQNADVDAVRLSVIGYVGVDFRLAPSLSLSLRLALSRTGDLEGTVHYIVHPLPDLTNTTSYGPLWLHDLLVAVRYEFWL